MRYKLFVTDNNVQSFVLHEYSDCCICQPSSAITAKMPDLGYNPKLLSTLVLLLLLLLLAIFSLSVFMLALEMKVSVQT
jgi:hypothetical protein